MRSKPISPQTFYFLAAAFFTLCLCLFITGTVVPMDSLLCMVLAVCCLIASLLLIGMGTYQENINRYCDSICLYRGDCEAPYHYGLECFLKKER